MTKKCTLKESFVEKQLDKFQPNWRDGEDITSDTKQKIRDYVIKKLPDELKEDVSCITDYSIWHMAKKIRERENLPEHCTTFSLCTGADTCGGILTLWTFLVIFLPPNALLFSFLSCVSRHA